MLYIFCRARQSNTNKNEVQKSFKHLLFYEFTHGCADKNVYYKGII